MRLYTVPTRLLPDIWALVEPFMRRAMAHHPLMDENELLSLLLAGKGALIVLSEDRIIAGAVMQRIRYPKQDVASVLAIGGESNSVLHRHFDALYRYLETWAEANGCGIITAFGRPGWTRFAARLGWSHKTVALGWKELGDDVRPRATGKDSATP